MSASSRPRGVSLSTYVAPDEAERLRRQALSEDRPLAAIIRRACRAYLAMHDDSHAEVR